MIIRLNRLAVLFITVLLCIGCNRANQQQPPSAPANVDSEARDFMLKPARNKARLLALKYAIPETTAITIATNYLMETDLLFRMLVGSQITNKTDLSLWQDVPIADTVNRISKQTGLDTKTVASFAYDLELWVKAEEAKDE